RRRRSEAYRILVMSLELGATGEAVWRAAEEMIEGGELPRLLSFLDGCGTEPAAEAIWNRIASPSVVHGLLLQEPEDFPPLERLLDRLGPAGAEPMLESLEVAENLTLRRRLVSRLSKMGPELAPVIVSRLPGKPWYVQRNLLLVLGAIGHWPPGFSPAPYANHSDSRVRR